MFGRIPPAKRHGRLRDTPLDDNERCHCEFLVDNRCAIYAQRPAICRRFICTDV